MPTMLKVVTGILAVCSLMVIWSEMTFFSLDPVLSLFAMFVNIASSKNNYLLIEVSEFKDHTFFMLLSL